MHKLIKYRIHDINFSTYDSKNFMIIKKPRSAYQRGKRMKIDLLFLA